jgi:DNA polymerase-3 subunit epsilon
MSGEAQSRATLEAMAKELDASASYRVLREFKAQDRYGAGPDESEHSVCFIDLETTGVETDDVPIEVGAVRVAYDANSGELGKVLERYTGMEDPLRPLPEHIVALTGIKDEDVKGKRFDTPALKGMVQRSSMLVSHNANFDRPMGERRFPWMSKRPWGCSMQDVPWKQAGVASVKLEFVAMTRGLFYGAHRALEDAEVAAAVSGKPLVDGKPAFAWIREQARSTWYRVWATDAPFEAKQKLKFAGYEWCDGTRTDHRAWRCVTKDPVHEMDFLAAEVYGFKGVALLQELDKYARFSERFTTQEWVSMARN